MRFVYPLGLLGLIGIPIVILIYIIKSQYAEQTISSVYLWELSEKFLKKRKRLNILGGMLSLILQVVIIAAISFSIAQPVLTIKNSANDYVFVLDASASMQIEYDDQTRFEKGIDEIQKVIKKAKKGSLYTLVLVGNTTNLLFEKVADKDVALKTLQNIDCSWLSSKCEDALSIVQAYYTEKHSPLTYLVTDKQYEVENALLINLANERENYSFASYEYHKLPTKIQISGQVVSQHQAADINLEYYVDGVLVGSGSVAVEACKQTEFYFETPSVDFSEIEIKIVNSDALARDNVAIMYAQEAHQNNKALLVSDNPAYISFALKSSGKTAVDCVTVKKYIENPQKYLDYGLYIFDSFNPSDSNYTLELPKLASVWFFNLNSSVKCTGFSFREIAKGEGSTYFEPKYTTAGDSFTKTLTKNITKNKLAVKQYSRYALNRKFTSILSVNGDDLIFVGTNENGNRQVVFAFDLHDSDFALNQDFLILTSNLLSYSFPQVIDNTQYQAGEIMTVNVPTSCTDMNIISPSGKTTYPDFSSATTEIALNETGTYLLSAYIHGQPQLYSVFVRVPNSESISAQDQNCEFIISSLTDNRASDGLYDSLIALFVLLAVVFILDWGVYCYEQYQLQ